jgi:hypothetical protein
MQLSVEILDHIFSFLEPLGPHRKTLIACSKDPVLSPIVERHLYCHVNVDINGGLDMNSNYAFELDHLSKLVSEDPRILYYVRILQIRVQYDLPWRQHSDMKRLDEFANTLLMFPALQCITLASHQNWIWPNVFRAALEDRLNLPTVKEFYLAGGNMPYFSFLDNCKNIRKLTLSALSGLPNTQGRFCASALPQLHSLRLLTPINSSSLLSWVKLHINELRSLQYAFSFGEDLSDLFRVCSRTLTNLDVNLETSQCMIHLSSDKHNATLILDCTTYTFQTGQTSINPLPEISPIPANLKQLTIRTAVLVGYRLSNMPQYWSSWLPAAAEMTKLFISSLQHLIVDVNLNYASSADLTLVDFSPLAVLGAAALSIPRIDLYVHTNILPPELIRAQVLSSLEEYEDIARAIKDGVLVIHSEETTPDVS